MQHEQHVILPWLAHSVAALPTTRVVEWVQALRLDASWDKLWAAATHTLPSSGGDAILVAETAAGLRTAAEEILRIAAAPPPEPRILAAALDHALQNLPTTPTFPLRLSATQVRALLTRVQRHAEAALRAEARARLQDTLMRWAVAWPSSLARPRALSEHKGRGSLDTWQPSRLLPLLEASITKHVPHPSAALPTAALQLFAATAVPCAGARALVAPHKFAFTGPVSQLRVVGTPVLHGKALRRGTAWSRAAGAGPGAAAAVTRLPMPPVAAALGTQGGATVLAALDAQGRILATIDAPRAIACAGGAAVAERCVFVLLDDNRLVLAQLSPKAPWQWHVAATLKLPRSAAAPRASATWAHVARLNSGAGVFLLAWGTPQPLDKVLATAGETQPLQGVQMAQLVVQPNRVELRSPPPQENTRARFDAVFGTVRPFTPPAALSNLVTLESVVWHGDRVLARVARSRVVAVWGASATTLGGLLFLPQEGGAHLLQDCAVFPLPPSFVPWSGAPLVTVSRMLAL